LLRASFRLLGSACTEQVVLFLMRITSSRKALNPHVKIHERREKDFCRHTFKLQRDLFMSMSIIRVTCSRSLFSLYESFALEVLFPDLSSFSYVTYIQAIWLVVYIATNISKITKYFWQTTILVRVKHKMRDSTRFLIRMICVRIVINCL